MKIIKVQTLKEKLGGKKLTESQLTKVKTSLTEGNVKMSDLLKSVINGSTSSIGGKKIKKETAKTMTTLKNTTGSKAVNITTDATGNVRAMYVQIYNGEQQVLQAKTFTTVKNAEKWANKILN